VQGATRGCGRDSGIINTQESGINSHQRDALRANSRARPLTASRPTPGHPPITHLRPPPNAYVSTPLQVDNYGSMDKGAWRGTVKRGCDSETVFLPTGDLACPRWCITYKKGKSNGRHGCFGRIWHDGVQTTVVRVFGGAVVVAGWLGLGGWGWVAGVEWLGLGGWIGQLQGWTVVALVPRL